MERLAPALKALEDYEHAELAFRELIKEAAPENMMHLHHELSYVVAKQGRNREAIRILLDGLKLSDRDTPDKFELLESLSYRIFSLKAWKEADREFRDLSKFHELTPETQARLYQSQASSQLYNQKEGALELTELGIKIEGSSANTKLELYSLLTDICIHKTNWLAARIACNEALKWASVTSPSRATLEGRLELIEKKEKGCVIL